MGAVRISTTARLQSIKDVTPYSLWSAHEAAKDERRILCPIQESAVSTSFSLQSVALFGAWSIKYSGFSFQPHEKQQ